MELSEKRGLLLSLRFWRPGASYLLCKASRPSHTTLFLFFTWKTQPGQILLWGLGSAKDTDATSYQGDNGPGKSPAQQSWGLYIPDTSTASPTFASCVTSPGTFRPGKAGGTLLPGWGRSVQKIVTPCGTTRQVLWPKLSVQPPWQVPCNEGDTGRPCPRCWEPRLKILLEEPFLDFSCNILEKKNEEVKRGRNGNLKLPLFRAQKGKDTRQQASSLSVRIPGCGIKINPSSPSCLCFPDSVRQEIRQSPSTQP